MFSPHLPAVGGEVKDNPDHPKASGEVEVVLKAGASRRADSSLAVVRASLGVVWVGAKAEISDGIINRYFLGKGLHWVVPK